MHRPLGYSPKPNQVCKLCLAFCSLKQAPHAWFEKF